MIKQMNIETEPYRAMCFKKYNKLRECAQISKSRGFPRKRKEKRNDSKKMHMDYGIRIGEKKREKKFEKDD